jgi:hypothetical protein
MAVSYVRSLLGLSLNDLTTYLHLARCDHTHFPDSCYLVSYIKIQPKRLPAIIALFEVVSSRLLKKLLFVKSSQRQAENEISARFSILAMKF